MVFDVSHFWFSVIFSWFSLLFFQCNEEAYDFLAFLVPINAYTGFFGEQCCDFQSSYFSNAEIFCGFQIRVRQFLHNFGRKWGHFGDLLQNEGYSTEFRERCKQNKFFNETQTTIFYVIRKLTFYNHGRLKYQKICMQKLWRCKFNKWSHNLNCMRNMKPFLSEYSCKQSNRR